MRSSRHVSTRRVPEDGALKLWPSFALPNAPRSKPLLPAAYAPSDCSNCSGGIPNQHSNFHYEASQNASQLSRLLARMRRPNLSRRNHSNRGSNCGALGNCRVQKARGDAVDNFEKWRCRTKAASRPVPPAPPQFKIPTIDPNRQRCPAVFHLPHCSHSHRHTDSIDRSSNSPARWNPRHSALLPGAGSSPHRANPGRG